MATLPRNIQAQLEAAEQVLQAANTPPEQTSEAPAATPEIPQPEPTTVASETPAPAEPPAAPNPPPVNWEHKFKTLQGLFNSQLPKLQEENKALKANLSEMQEAIKALQSSKPSEPQASAPAVDPKDVDAFGADLVDMVKRITDASIAGFAAKVSASVSSFDSRLKALEQQLQGTAKTVEMTAEELFFGRITKAVPDWETVNADERFHAWLAEVDPILGQPRQAALDFAQQHLNAERAIAVFQAFKATVPQAPKTNPLEAQIAPKTSVSSAPAPAAKPTITQAEIQRFYDDVAKGRYRGREQEAALREQTINQAIAEGRIR